MLVEQHPELGLLPSYATIRRWMKAHGLLRARRRQRPATAGEARAEVRIATFETRSFEAEYIHALWHLDFHVGSRRVLVPQGRWVTPHLLGVLGDRSRLSCHLQWYRAKRAETLVHGLSQAIMKRGRSGNRKPAQTLPRFRRPRLGDKRISSLGGADLGDAQK